jgi:hypothetical protein
MFDLSTHRWLKGTVVSYQAINPHALIELDVTGPDGSVQRWIVEGPRLLRIEAMELENDFVSIGDVIEVCGFFYKNDVSRSSGLHGQVVVRPDGQKWQWGPYGRLESCVPREEWDTIATGKNRLRTD